METSDVSADAAQPAGRGSPTGPGSSPPALAIRGIRRTFGPKVAVAGVDLAIAPGSFTGLLGPNGAGKSTLIAATVGLDRHDTGTSEVFGHDVWNDALQARRLMGVLPDNLALPEHLSGRELLGYWGTLHGMDAGYEAMRRGEQIAFWTLAILGILAIIPQGLVALAHLAFDTGVTVWFLALRLPEHLQGPAAAGMIALGLCLWAIAALILRAAIRRERHLAELRHEHDGQPPRRAAPADSP